MQPRHYLEARPSLAFGTGQRANEDRLDHYANLRDAFRERGDVPGIDNAGMRTGLEAAHCHVNERLIARNRSVFDLLPYQQMPDLTLR
jgi:hypothetical protein